MKTILCSLVIFALLVSTRADDFFKGNGTVYLLKDDKLILSPFHIYSSNSQHHGQTYLALQNYTGSDAVTGKQIRFSARYVTNVVIDDFPVELWDCNAATPPPKPVVVVPPPRVLTPEEIKAIAARNEKEKQTGEAAALKWNQSQADKGDDYGELRMGERYLKGDGVEKDLAKAKNYFSKSAAQGNLEASNALVKIDLVSTNTVSAGAP
jgi:TPR repeat protein